MPLRISLTALQSRTAAKAGETGRSVQVCVQGQRKLPDRISQEIRILEYKDRLCENQGVPRILYKAEAK